jgi:hypothetical protein
MSTYIANRTVLALAILAMAGAMAGFATTAQANSSFTDGGFTGFTGSGATCTNNPATNTQQVTNTDLPSWSVNSNYTFILNTNNYGNFSNTYGGFSNSCIGLQPTITSPPIGSVFLGIDPAFQNNNDGNGWSIAQTVTNLVVGATYAVTFDMGAGQQKNFSGPTTDTWLVGLGNSVGTGNSGSSQTLSLPSGGFSGWVGAEVDLVASAASEVLWFFAESTSLSTQPPFLLLDGISVSQQTTVPEPSTYGVLLVGLLALLGVRRLYRKKA